MQVIINYYYDICVQILIQNKDEFVNLNWIIRLYIGNMCLIVYDYKNLLQTLKYSSRNWIYTLWHTHNKRQIY